MNKPIQVLVLLLVAAPATWAATFNVNSNADAVDFVIDGTCETAPANGVCTLRAAVQEANAMAGTDTINLPADVYLLSLGAPGDSGETADDLDLTDSVTISGAGASATSVSGGLQYRVFEVSPGVTADLSGLTITAGSIPGGPGGGIFNEGTLILSDARVTTCTAADGGGINDFRGGGMTLSNVEIDGNTGTNEGGGIRTEGSATSVTNVTISNNDVGAGKGGGIFVKGSGGFMTITNSTVSQNMADSGGGVHVERPVTLVNVTIVGNIAASGGGIDYGGGPADAQLTNTIVAGNTGGDCGVAITSVAANLDSDTTCGVALTADPRLGPLQNNGGPTLTHALLIGSPAIDAGDNPGCPLTDQRGVARPYDGDSDATDTCDIGAYELNPLVTVDLAIAKTTTVISGTPGTVIPYTIVVSNLGPADAFAIPVTDTFDPLIFNVPAITWSCTITTGTGSCPAPGSGDINTTVDLSSSSTATFTVSAPTLGSASGLVANTATVTVPAGGTDPDLSNNSITDTTPTIGAIQLAISGKVREDVNGDASIDPGDDGVPNVTVYLYRDDGNGVPDAADPGAPSTTTDASGDFVFSATDGYTYWVTTDSSTVSPSVAFNGTYTQNDVWAEQTYGTAGSRCDDGIGGVTELAVAGPCYGGQAATTSDDSSTIATAEHVGRAVLSGGNVSGLDAAFSFTVIVSNLDGDDDLGSNRSVQGSLRQFIQNSNALDGVQTSEFRLFGAAPHSILVQPPGLPAMDDPLVLDGRKQAGFVDSPIVEIDGTAAGNVTGLFLTAPDSTIRGVVVNSFEVSGIRIDGVAASNNLVEGNYVGVNVAGTLARGNGKHGIEMNKAPNNTIGGITPLARNVTSGNSTGVNIDGGTATGNVVIGNFIGTDKNGTADIPNATGVQIKAASGNTIGGTSADRQNVISGNSGNGITIDGSGATGNFIQGNHIGVDVNGAALGNGGDGILSKKNAGSNIIGGAAPGAANVIAHNGDAGVELNKDAGTGNTIRANSIHDNVGLGINLIDAADVGVTLNDLDDLDSGVNDLLNFPVLDTAAITAGNLELTGWARPDSVIEVFVSDGDAGEFGEGETLVVTVTEDGTGAGGDDPYADLDPTTGVYGSGAVNGIVQGDDDTNRFRFVFPTPGGVNSGTILTATATDVSGSTSEFSGQVTVAGPATWDISGTVYHDSNTNNLLDVGELGIGTVWVKLVSGGSVDQVVQADPDTGAYTIPGVIDGSYTVIVDDNSNPVDATPTEPVNWLFQNPATGSLAVTVAAADVSDEDFGFTFDFDLGADCACGYEDGLLTQAAITIDGDMSDWGTVFSDGDNNACDATDDTDLDHPVQSTGRNLLRTAVTYDGTYFSMWTQRIGQSSNTQNFVYYADSNADGIMQDGEPVVVAKWQGATGNVVLELYTYDDLSSGGDSMLDGSGFADGYSLPGDLDFVKALALPDGVGQGSTSGASDGTQMEWTIEWAELGVPPGSAIGWHVGSTNSNPAAAGLGAQIDDNVGGCGGQCTGSNQFSGIQASPGNGDPGETVYVPHSFTNTGNGSDLFDLAWTSSGDFVPTSVVFYRDLGTVGEYDAGVDTLILDTGNLAPGASFDMLVAIELPGPPAVGSVTVTTTATSNFVPGCGGTVIPESGSVDDVVEISYTISGTVFEDVNYGGGVGRDLAAAQADAPSFAVKRGNVTVELYDAAGTFIGSTTTAVADGSYEFTGLATVSYIVRVVNDTVTSSRPGSDGSELCVQTYRIDGDGEAAGAGPKKVGGELPSNEDAAANSGAQTLASLQGTDLDTDGVPEWTQSIVEVDLTGGDVVGIDFGFNFDVVVNTNDAGQGSLRQFILNSNLLN